MTKPLCVELGGGSNPKPGFINVDQCDSADVRIDLETVGPDWPLPFHDGVVDEVYSAHCLEHVRNLRRLLPEIARICKVGASIEIRTPHPFSEMAMCYGHVHAIGEEQVRHWCESCVPYWFGDSPRRFWLERIERIPSQGFMEAERLFPHMTTSQIMRFIPSTCHETRFFITVVANQ